MGKFVVNNLERKPNENVHLYTSIIWLKMHDEISVRTFNALKEHNCKSVYHILTLDIVHFRQLRNVGLKTFSEVKSFIDCYIHLLNAENIENIKDLDISNSLINTENNVLSNEDGQISEVENNISKFADEISDIEDAEYQAILESKKNLLHVIKRLYSEFERWSEVVTHPIRVYIDLDPDNKPKIGFAPIEYDNITKLLNFKERNREPIEKKKRMRFEIRFPDGTEIKDDKPYKLFVKFIEFVGENRIFELQIDAIPDVPLLSKEKPKTYRATLTENGFYLFTEISFLQKISIIKLISRKLCLNISVFSKKKAF